MAIANINVRFSGDNFDKNGNFESGLFQTSLPTDCFSKATATDIINEQILPQLFRETITASGFGRSEAGWNFTVSPKSAATKELIESLAVGEEREVSVDVVAPDDFDV